MPTIRIAAAVAALTAALTLTAVAATDCPPGASGCKASSIAQPGTPLHLNQFIKHPAQHKAATVAAKPPATQQTASKTRKTHTRLAAKPVTAPAPSLDDPQPPAESKLASDVPAQSSNASETNGVAVTSADEVNELDAAADNVQVVAANELNEIDMAADSGPVTTGAAVENAQPAPDSAIDNSWIGKLLAALGGMVAVASVARLLIA